MPNPREYLAPTGYNRTTPPSDPASQMAYLLEELEFLQTALNDATEGSVQATDSAPLAPRYGTVRYALGDWATGLGANGLYVFKDDDAWHLIV